MLVSVWMVQLIAGCLHTVADLCLLDVDDYLFLCTTH